jgi:hypothetical protein
MDHAMDHAIDHASNRMNDHGNRRVGAASVIARVGREGEVGAGGLVLAANASLVELM